MVTGIETKTETNKVTNTVTNMAADIGKSSKKAAESKENIGSNTRVAIIGVIVEDAASVEKLNQLLHQYGTYIIGRMGIPYRERGINIISIAIDAPADVISALSGKLGALKGVSSKAVYSKV